MGRPQKEPKQQAVDESKQLLGRIAELERLVGKQQLAIGFSSEPPRSSRDSTRRGPRLAAKDLRSD